MANIIAAVPGIVGAVVNVGWWVANANRVREIVNKGMEIADERSKDCVRIFQNAIDSMLQKGGQIFGKWNKAAIGAANVITAVFINHLVHKYSPEKCKDDSFSLDCLPNLAATSVCSAAIAGWGVKTVKDLWSPNSSLEQQGFGRVAVLESNARAEGPERQLSTEERIVALEPNARIEQVARQVSTEESHGLEDKMPYFKTKGKKSISVSYPLDIIMGVDGNKFFFKTPDQLRGKFWGKQLTTVRTLVGENNIAEVVIKRKDIEIKPRIPGDNLKILLKSFSCYRDSITKRTKLESLKFHISSESRSKSVTIKIKKEIGEFWIWWDIIKYSHERRNM